MGQLKRKKKTFFKSYKRKNVRSIGTKTPGISGVFTETISNDDWNKLRESLITINTWVGVCR